MSPVVDLLKEMRSRSLAVYLGSASLRKLADFLRGYDYALQRQNGDDNFLSRFRDWIHRRFQTTDKSWEECVLAASDSETGALSTFWELLDQFLAETQGNQPNSPPVPIAAGVQTSRLVSS